LILSGFSAILCITMVMRSKVERNKEIVKKRKLGWTLRKIGDFYNLHHSTVVEIIRRWSVENDKIEGKGVDN